jgi:DNA-binding beta-propeller fold protein YncE
MGAVLGTGQHCYEVDEQWMRLPAGWCLGDVGGIGVDSQDRVYVFHRGEHPMLIFSPDGELVDAWGDDLFPHAHGIHIGPDDTLYLTDDGDHTVRRCTPDGEVMLCIGVPGDPSGDLSGEPFNRCTHTALSPTGDIYVADGYNNARVHKYSPRGDLLFSWGEPGTRPGQFNIPHNIVCDAGGRVYVADRENHRVQVFDGEGQYVDQWNNLHRPCALALDRHGRFYVGEVGPELSVNRRFPNLGEKITVTDADGALLAELGDGRPGTRSDQFLAPHAIAVNSQGDLFVGEVAGKAWPLLFPNTEAPPDLRTFRRLVRVD